MHVLRAKAIQLVALAWALTAGSAVQANPQGIQPESDKARCEIISAGLRKLEASAHSTLAEVHYQRRHAQQLADWFGREPFEAFIAALREQEHSLQATLEEIAAMECPAGAPESPSSTEERGPRVQE
jgi:hypothetical protein